MRILLTENSTTYVDIVKGEYSKKGTLSGSFFST